MTTLTGIQIEGNLITLDLTTELLGNQLKGQTPKDFGIAPANKLEDEIAIAWGDAKTYWAAFQRRLAKLAENQTATSLTREYWAVPLLESLGYKPEYQAKAEIVEGQTFAISHRAEAGEDKPPIHIIGGRLKLEQKAGTPRLSAHALMQEYLNCTEHLWGIVTNGSQWRLLRDCSLMTRLTYIEFDLEQILKNENYAEFGLFYRLFHRTRLPEGREDTDKCLLEFYHQQTLQQGGRVRDRLRDGVEQAIELLGTGFLQHPKNQNLRDKIDNEELTEKDYYRQLLLLIYRLLFLMVAEGRNILLIGEDTEKARIYNEYYSVERLRILAERPSFRREGFQDLWQGLRVTFEIFDENWRGEILGLSPLNGDLFGSNVLQSLDGCAIDNYDLLKAIHQLSLYTNKGQLRRVNYAALDVEELGSVYESLLDFAPKVETREGIYEFKLVTGSERKTTGSYYTPPELVAQLIKTALEPVIEERLKEVQTLAEREGALLSLTVCDPACGSGHFLLAAARRIGKELARVRTGESQPGVEPIREAIRDVIQHCIYGVDLNPLAVDLCKVALWIEGFNRGKPLSFLDHRIKCGNSLVGVLDLACLQGGIPDNAYKAVTGDDKTIASRIKKENKQQCKNQGQFSLNFDNLSQERSYYGQTSYAIAQLPEEKTGDIKQKQEKYRDTREESQDNPWWRDTSACNLWTAAFFAPLTEQKLPQLPTSSALFQLLQGNWTTQKVVNAANKLAKEKRFFHWALEFPEVFENGGFSCVLGNPPWERIKLQEKEFFATKDSAIANAKNKAARTKLINKLATSNPQLLAEFEDAKHDADATSKFLRESNRCPLTSRGDINTYSVFAETTRNIISTTGRVGIIVPTGIATDDTCKNFFGDLTQKQNLASLYDFENREKLFAAVDSRMKFSLLGMSDRPIQQANFSFFLTQPKQIESSDRVFQLSPQDIALINPNTLTCPVFRSRTDAELTKKIYQRVPVLENEKTDSNPWGISFMRMFDMSNDSGLFKNEAGNNSVPLYEAKMFHQFDHRWATYTEDGSTRDLTDGEKGDRVLKPQPRYWVDRQEVENKLGDKWNKDWLLAFRGIANFDNERTGIFSALPKVGAGNSAPIIFTSVKNNKLISCLLGNFCSLIFDFVVRKKIGRVNFNFFIVKQLPVIPPENYTEEDIKFISDRVLELVYTAWDMQPFAKDMGYDGEPFIWDEQRRAILRAELDAYYTKLYGLTRDELRYILDPADVYGKDFPSETFRVLKNNEIKKYGEYRTQRLVLSAWDRMFE
ncbi:MAG: N-6 DNA methylase [Xenococcaceae cyanobacterium]